MISVVVPIHNEEELLEVFLSDLISYLEKFQANYEIIAVENGSTDNNQLILQKFAASNRRIKTIKLVDTSYGLALKSGILHSTKNFIIVYNVDFWDKRFIHLCKEDLGAYDIIVGSKRLDASVDNRPLPRRLISSFFNRFVHLALGYEGTDTHGIKVLRSKTILPIVEKCYGNTNLFDTELMVRAQRVELRIKEVSVRVQEVRPSRFRHRYIKILPELVCLYLRLLKT